MTNFVLAEGQLDSYEKICIPKHSIITLGLMCLGLDTHCCHA